MSRVRCTRLTCAPTYRQPVLGQYVTELVPAQGVVTGKLAAIDCPYLAPAYARIVRPDIPDEIQGYVATKRGGHLHIASPLIIGLLSLPKQLTKMADIHILAIVCAQGCHCLVPPFFVNDTL